MASFIYSNCGLRLLGTNWTTSSHNLGTGRYSVECSTAGTQTATIAFGGLPGGNGVTTTEQYDGSSWTTVAALATGRSYLAGAGTSAAALAVGGGNGPFLNATEEWTDIVNAVTSLDVS